MAGTASKAAVGVRRDSMNFPPDLGVLLLGNNPSQRSELGNLILGTRAFDSYTDPCCEKLRISNEDRCITVINTPNVLDHNTKVRQKLKHLAVSLSGCEVFVLVLQPEQLNEEERSRMQTCLDMLSDCSLDFSIVFIPIGHRERHTNYSFLYDPSIYECVSQGRQKPYIREYPGDQTQLFQQLDQILEGNQGKHLSVEMYDDATRISYLDNKKSKSTDDELSNNLTEKDYEKDIAQLKGKAPEHNREINKKIASTLRIVLLGKSDIMKTFLGNKILGGNVFTSSKGNTSKQCVSGSGDLNGKIAVVVKSPDLFVREDQLIKRDIGRCISLCSPGPNILLLLLKLDEFKKEDFDRLNTILALFGGEAGRHSIVLTTHKGETTNDYVQSMIEKCKGRHFKIHQEIFFPSLLKEMEEMVIANGCSYLTHCEDIQVSALPALNLILCGRKGVGKTLTSNAILGKKEPCPGSNTRSSECQKRNGEVCGHHVTLVEMPALYGRPQEEVMRETLHCVSQFYPPGVHAFLLVVPVGPLTDEDKDELNTLKHIFSAKVFDFATIVFTCNSSPASQKEITQLEKSKDYEDLFQSCGKRFAFLDETSLVNPHSENSELLGKILKGNTDGSCYTPHMYVTAQLEMKEKKHEDLVADLMIDSERKNERIKELEDTLQPLHKDSQTGNETNCVRMVLIGKTGNGKSATGNTILGSTRFKSLTSMASVTNWCQKEMGEVDGRAVTVVDTPGLFDTTLKNEEVLNEIVKCMSLLAPGPHVFLLVLQIGRITQEEKATLDLIKGCFGKNSGIYTIILFTRADDISDQALDSYIENGDSDVKKLIHDCGGRVHAFNNRDQNNRSQVTKLMQMIDKMIMKNGGGFYTNEMFQEAEASIRKEVEKILIEKEKEMEKERKHLKIKYEQEMKRRISEERHDFEVEQKRRQDELKKKEKYIERLCQEQAKKEQAEKERRQAEGEERAHREAIQRSQWEKIIKDMEEAQKRQQNEWESEKERRKFEEMERLERDKREWTERLNQETKEFQRQQMKNKIKIDEGQKKEKEENERIKKDWARKIKEAEKDKKEIQEELTKKSEEWKEQHRKTLELKKAEEMERQTRERNEWERQISQIQLEFEKEKQEDKIKKEAGEKERKIKEQIMRSELEAEKREMKRQQEEWEQQRKIDQDNRNQEDRDRQKREDEKLAKLKEEHKKKKDEELKRLDEAKKLLKDKESKRICEIKDAHEKELNDIKKKTKENARKHAEQYNEFITENKKLKKKLEKNQKKCVIS